MPVGGLAVPRSNSVDTAVSMAIFNNEDELLKGAFRAFPKLKTSKDKMRFDDEYDASKSGGYRDVQLSVRIDTAWTREHGLDKILCEVQLHDAEFHERKTMGGGHTAYVMQRNMLGQ